MCKPNVNKHPELRSNSPSGENDSDSSNGTSSVSRNFIDCDFCLEPQRFIPQRDGVICSSCREFYPTRPILTRQTGVSIPAPTLIGIELNPGPKQKTNNVPAQPKKAAGRARRRKRRNQRKKEILNESTRLLIQHYKNVLDPFNFSPVLHDIDCTHVPIQFATTKTGTLTLNADGSGFIAVCPGQVMKSNGSLTNVRDAFVTLNNSAAATTGTYTGSPAPNVNALAAQYPSHKVISCALRATPLFAQTAAPGIIYGDTIVSGGGLSLNTYAPSTNNLSALTSSKRCVAKSGESYRINWVADTGGMDNEYSTQAARALNDRNVGSIIFLAFTGFPASSSLLYEVILHGEGFLPNDGGAGLTAYPALTGNDSRPSLNKVGIDNIGLLYDPPVHSEFRPYEQSESDMKYEKQSAPGILSGINDTFQKFSGTLSTVGEVASAISDFF